MLKKILVSLLIIPVLYGLSSFKNETITTTETENTVASNSFALVQLFTSQGCSSCPSADALLEKISERYKDKNVFVLSYHVDYWNRLGWKDVFSKKEYSDMQYSYSAKFGGSTVYTPQAIVNGDIQFVGSNEAKMENSLAKFLKQTSENTILFSDIEKNGKQLSLTYEVTGDVARKNLKIALVINKKQTNVKRGENGGRKLTNVNVVVVQKEISLGKTEDRVSLTIPEIVEEGDSLSLVGFTQNKNFTITAATAASI